MTASSLAHVMFCGVESDGENGRVDDWTLNSHKKEAETKMREGFCIIREKLN